MILFHLLLHKMTKRIFHNKTFRHQFRFCPCSCSVCCICLYLFQTATEWVMTSRRELCKNSPLIKKINSLSVRFPASLHSHRYRRPKARRWSSPSLTSLARPTRHGTTSSYFLNLFRVFLFFITKHYPKATCCTASCVGMSQKWGRRVLVKMSSQFEHL